VTNFNRNSCKNISNHQHTKQYLRKIRENVWDCHNVQKKILFNSSLLLDLDSFLQQANTINCPKQWLASLAIKLYNFCRNGHFPVQRRFACFSSCSCSRAETLGKSGTASLCHLPYLSLNQQQKSTEKTQSSDSQAEYITHWSHLSLSTTRLQKKGALLSQCQLSDTSTLLL